MSLNGINNSALSRALSPAMTNTQAAREQAIRQQQPQTSRGIAPSSNTQANVAQRAVAQAPGAASALPVEAPAGTDPALWSILSSEERSFFAKAQTMGPLTYGRVMSSLQQPAMPATRGGRLDIRG